MKGCLDAQGATLNHADTGFQKSRFNTIPRTHHRKPVLRSSTANRPPTSAPSARNILRAATAGSGATIRTSIAPIRFALTRTAKHTIPRSCTISRHVSHEFAFDFPRAFQLDQQLVAQDSTPAYRLDLEEAALTADQFSVCMAQAAALQDSDLNSSQIIVRDTILLACQYASGNKSAAQTTAASLANRVNQIVAGDVGFRRHALLHPDVKPFPGRKRRMGQALPESAKWRRTRRCQRAEPTEADIAKLTRRLPDTRTPKLTPSSSCRLAPRYRVSWRWVDFFSTERTQKPCRHLPPSISVPTPAG